MKSKARRPPPMTMDEALASINPLAEIDIRLKGSFEELTEPEKQFWAASYFLGDTLNGGLHQTLGNDTGYWSEMVRELVREHCCVELARVFDELSQLFPEGKVPLSREARNAFLEQMEHDGRDAVLDDLTDRFYALEEEFIRGLLQFASNNRNQFCGMKREGDGNHAV